MFRLARSTTRATLGITALISLAAGQANAQHLSIAPTIGIYAPTTDLVNSLINGDTVAFKQKVGLALGGRLGLWFGRRFGISVTGAFVPSKLQATVTQTGVQTQGQQNSDLWFGTGRVNLWLLPPTGILSVGVNGGVGVVGRGKTTIDDPSNPGSSLTDPSRTDIGGVAGATVGVNLGGLGLFVSADDYIYNPKVFTQLGAKPTRQNDIQISFGLGVPLGGKM
ncbi:MAG: hypothetical protein ABJD11_00260 [Gemmatimonadota bacterium]